MAKAGFTLYGARGKVGNLVARKGEKGTVLTEYKVPNNPQTSAQMRTRIAFATVSKAGAALADLVGISFQGETTIKAARRRFNGLNISKLAQQIKRNEADGQFAPKGLSLLIPNKYVVADGTIRNATFGVIDVDGIGEGFTQTSVNVDFGLGSFTPTEIINKLYGCEPGDQVTVVGIRVGTPVEYNAEKLQILRDGQMVSVRATFKDAAQLAELNDFTFAADTTAAQLATYIKTLFDADKSNSEFLEVITKADGFTVNNGSVQWDIESAVGYGSFADIFGNSAFDDSNGKWVVAVGYFRSHLNSTGTQWMFSRCVLTLVDPVYNSTTYGSDHNINYGYKYGVAYPTYVRGNLRENTRYTETGGSINQLGF